MTKQTSIASRLLFALGEIADISAGQLDAFLLSQGSTTQLKKNLKIFDRQYFSALQGLERNGYIKKIDRNHFLISPKALARIRKLKKIQWNESEWNGTWIIISFDIPEQERVKRDIFRSRIQGMGFVRLQNSVFIAPFADLEELSVLRKDLKIEKYVTFFQAKICETEDDSKLKQMFGL